MVRTLIGEGVPNIQTPTTEYPFGRYKNKTTAGTNDGTELSERVLGDCYQAMLNTITGAGMTPNNEPERKGGSQFQKAVELLKPVATCVVGSDDGSTFGVLSSVIRDPGVTLSCGYNAYQSENDVVALSACLQILRNGVLDTSRRYIVTATPAYKFSGATVLSLALTPKVMVAHSPYFNNMNIFISNLSNLFFFFSQELPPSNAISLSRAVLAIYDAGIA